MVGDKGAAPFKEISGEGGLDVRCVRNLGFHFPSPENIRFVYHMISLMWSSFPRGQSLRCTASAGPGGKSGRGSLAAGGIRSQAMLA